jgi:hypothetical protein
VQLMADPVAQWPLVRQRPAEVQALWLDYALWWVLLGALLHVGVGLGLAYALHGAGGVPWFSVISGAVVMLAGGMAGVLALAFLARMFATSLGAAQPQWDDGLRLVAYGLTPVWLGLALWQLPLVGGWLILGALVYAGLCVWRGLDHVLGVVPDKRPALMWRLGAAAVGVWLVVTALQLVGVVLLVGALVGWLNLRSRPEFTQALRRTHKPPSVPPAAGAAAEVNAKAATEPGVQLDAHWGRPSADLISAPASVQEMPPIHPLSADKIAALDKKIAKALASGDMAQVTQLMGEQQALRMGVATADPRF